MPAASCERSGRWSVGSVNAKELLRHVEGRCEAARIEDFEDENRASRYWIVLTK